MGEIDSRLKYKGVYYWLNVSGGVWGYSFRLIDRYAGMRVRGVNDGKRLNYRKAVKEVEEIIDLGLVIGWDFGRDGFMVSKK